MRIYWEKRLHKRKKSIRPKRLNKINHNLHIMDCLMFRIVFTIFGMTPRCKVCCLAIHIPCKFIWTRTTSFKYKLMQSGPNLFHYTVFVNAGTVFHKRKINIYFSWIICSMMFIIHDSLFLLWTNKNFKQYLFNSHLRIFFLQTD